MANLRKTDPLGAQLEENHLIDYISGVGQDHPW